ncbi:MULTISPECIES: DUF2790 domain-containing protein [Pseudomonas]|jgi:CRISPR/Cas system type I-B associated protein Csh2 (Cas7 group RAMP superfamily)|uniref:DUF2790 domain-containing protein n=2 Tax=Pseudomonas putida group TaxID=136845 RepID=A0A2A3M499_PSEDL|nr:MULTISPECIES: DUF2790 domain-containing protein [Pseudomonas]AHC81900.1 hypothetical protein X969_07915 [Pseudomonas monteilii SB3078]AHC87329.1 hypothetical protein X970_07890 [Pseudomonas monteilii SB3101]AHZ76760.1 hypothetical protein DW66_2245 [Pseudomonas putida]KAF4557719.1 DUF2790 domain-containing protein [Pseudomonas sp. CES]KGK25025.1 hypothetical protein GT93_09295 [Pseudomonas plecoglossicida]
MNFNTFARASLFAVLSFGAIAAQASTMPMDNSGVMQYRYGDHLDVKKVLSIQDDQSDACGLVNTRMDYLDSKGQQQSVQYRTYATGGCHEN